MLLANLLEVAMIRGFGDSGSRGGEGSGGDEELAVGVDEDELAVH